MSPDKTPPVLVAAHDPVDLARRTVGRYALDSDDEAMLLELLGLLDVA